MKILPSLMLSAAMVSGLALAASAQSQETTTTTVTQTYRDSTCGAWQADVWVPNATCTGDQAKYRHERMAGTITSVKGHLVTIQMTDKSVVINDQPALNQKMTGKVAVGRQIVAHGYWQDGTFYATLLTTSAHAAAAM